MILIENPSSQTPPRYGGELLLRPAIFNSEGEGGGLKGKGGGGAEKWTPPLQVDYFVLIYQGRLESSKRGIWLIVQSKILPHSQLALTSTLPRINQNFP